MKKVETELRDAGLDPATLQQFFGKNNVDYNLEETDADTHQIRPRLTVTVHFCNGALVNVSLTPATRHYLENLSPQYDSGQPNQASLEKEYNETGPDIAAKTVSWPSVISSISSASIKPSEPGSNDNPSGTIFSGPGFITTKKIDVPLVFDAKFFSILQADILSLSRLQDEEEAIFQSYISMLKSDLSRAVQATSILSVVPAYRSGGGDDMSIWREIFRLYLDANVFFSTVENDHGDRTSIQAAKALQWWQEQMQKQGLISKFKPRVKFGKGKKGRGLIGEKMVDSHAVLDRFVQLNASILMNLKFQELNRTAVAKILKKFDKHTALSPTKPTYQLLSRTRILSTNKLLALSVARDMATSIATELVTLVPQLQDYLCPVCENIASYPMKPSCGHIICSRCMNKMLRKKMFRCPLCRIDITQPQNARKVFFH